MMKSVVMGYRLFSFLQILLRSCYDSVTVSPGLEQPGRTWNSKFWKVGARMMIEYINEIRISGVFRYQAGTFLYQSVSYDLSTRHVTMRNFLSTTLLDNSLAHPSPQVLFSFVCFCKICFRRWDFHADGPTTYENSETGANVMLKNVPKRIKNASIWDKAVLAIDLLFLVFRSTMSINSLNSNLFFSYELFKPGGLDWFQMPIMFSHSSTYLIKCR